MGKKKVGNPTYNAFVKEVVQTILEKWRLAMKKKKMKGIRSETHYMAVNKKIAGQFNLQGLKMEKVK